jgi:hypothetical protein
MKNILRALLIVCLLLSLNAHAAITLQQTWVGNNAYSYTGVQALSNVPATNSIVVVAVSSLTSMAPSETPSDNFGDSGTWVALQQYVNVAYGYTMSMWYKVIGTPSGGGKTVTVTSSVRNDISIAVAEYATSSAGTWSTDTQSAVADTYSNSINPGAITTTGGGVIVGTAYALPTLTSTGSGFTSRLALATAAATLYISDNISTAAGTYNATWSRPTSTTWSAGQSAIKFTAGAATTYSRSAKIWKYLHPSVVSFDSAPSSTCPQGTGVADGCSSALIGTPQLPNIMDVQKVTALNIITGSGYTDGTYNWTTTGGGGSGATGTITVSGGKLGGTQGFLYTITNMGSGYTSRPTIVASIPAGSGGSYTADVYQATPHNAATPWNMPGVDYYVGYPVGQVFKDPTTDALPSGATYSSGKITVTGCGVTLDGYDFTLHDTLLEVAVTSDNCTTTVQNSKQHAINPFGRGSAGAYPIAYLHSTGANSKLVYQYNEYDGLSPYGHLGGSGFNVNAPIGLNGSITLKYNYFHHFDAKIFQVSGSPPNVGAVVDVENNLFSYFGGCGTNSSTPTGPCDHGSGGYTYAGSGLGSQVSMVFKFNTYYDPMYIGDSGGQGINMTALQAVQADDLQITSAAFDHNVLLAQGPQSTCPASSNATPWEAGALVYDGAQNDPDASALNNGVFAYNYMDASGVYYPWTHSGTINSTTWTNNIDAGTGVACN